MVTARRKLGAPQPPLTCEHPMRRRSFIHYAAGAAAAAAAVAPWRPVARPQAFELDEATIASLQEGMRSGRYTSRSLCEAYLARIDAVDRVGPALRAVLETNPDALAIADRLDADRKARRPRGPLHGIPVLIKDNIATADRMMTTAGSLALLGVTPPRDSVVAERLPAAGRPRTLTRSTATPAVRAPAPAPRSPRTSRPWASAPKPTARSSVPPRR